MTITKTQIVNQALAHVGETGIADYENDTDRKAQLARLFYPQALGELFEALEWSFATKRAELDTPVDDGPLFEFTYAFTLPSDFEAIVETDPSDAVWRIENNQLLTDEASIGIVYTFDQTNTARFSAGMVSALSWLLAAKLAMPITRKPEYVTLAMQMYGGVLATARHQDSKQSSRPIEPLDTLTRVRYNA